jgi:hypothetical protein
MQKKTLPRLASHWHIFLSKTSNELNTNHPLMNYWYCIICRISNYSKLPTANFFPFFHKKRSKYDVFRTYWKYCVFSVLFQDEPKTRIKCNIMEMRFGKRLCWKYILQFPSIILNVLIYFRSSMYKRLECPYHC